MKRIGTHLGGGLWYGRWIVALLFLTACGVADSGVELLVVQKDGSGGGTVSAISDNNKKPDQQEGGIDCGARCQDWYYEGDAITLTATPNADSVFSGWSGDCAGAASPLSIVLGDHGSACAATFTSTIPPSVVVVTWAEAQDVFVARSTDDGVTFGAPVNISNGGAPFAPQLTIEGDTVLIVWEQDEDGNGLCDIWVAHSSDGGVVFGDAQKLSEGETAFGPQLAIEGDTVMVAWADGPLGEIFTARSIDGGVAFGNAQKLSEGETVFGPQLAIEGDTVMVAWEDFPLGEIFTARSSDGGATFDTPANRSNTVGYSYVPRLAMEGGVVMLAWSDDTPGSYDVFTVRSTDGGITFGGVSNLSDTPSVESFDPQLAIVGETVLAVWEEAGEIVIARSTDRGDTFGPVGTLSNSGPAASAAFAMGEGGALLVAWEDYSGNLSEIFSAYSSDFGATFGPIINVSDTVGESVSSRAALVGDTLLVTWRDDTAGGNDIYVTRSTNSGLDFGTAVNVSDSDGSVGDSRIGFVP